jgi:uncharacterized protein YecE (DUF72 family)
VDTIQKEVDNSKLSQFIEKQYLGTMGWSYSFWPIYIGKKQSEYLEKYSKIFNSVEINSTFYRIPRKSSVKNWVSQTPEDFRFSVKVPKSISHSSELKYDTQKLDAFIDHIKPFGKKLGILLIQLPPKLSPKHKEQLNQLLSQLQDYNVAVEFRQKEWFDETTYKSLRDLNTALVYVDHPYRVTKKVETSDFNYIRLEGDRKKVDGEKGITEIDRTHDNLTWAENIREQVERNRATYLYISKYYSGYPPNDLKQITSNILKIKINK